MFDLWQSLPLDPYRLLRPLLFRLEPEQAHTLALTLLKKGLGPKIKKEDDPILHTIVCGLGFRNPIGLAAGFDKNAEIIDEVLQLGFGFAEIGTITPQPQAGNPKPRMFRAPEANAVINRLGFNSDGMDICLQRIKAWYDRKQPRNANEKIPPKRGLIGINIGKNKDSDDAASDYTGGFRLFAPYADYMTINISSPNTPGLRDLQEREPLTDLLQKINAAREALAKKPPLFVKIAPDLTDAQMETIADVIMNNNVQGLIVGNTTVSRLSGLPAAFAAEKGGLSGKPLLGLSTRVLARIYKLTQGKIALIGCGGVMSGGDAYAKIRAGASLVQLYTGLVFEGPGLVMRIKRDLAALLNKDGFKSVREAVGKGNT